MLLLISSINTAIYLRTNCNHSGEHYYMEIETINGDDLMQVIKLTLFILYNASQCAIHIEDSVCSTTEFVAFVLCSMCLQQ